MNRRIGSLLVVLFLIASDAFACTAFKVTQGGRTIVGNNEDAWSLNARIRFENGGAGEYGAVYLGHFNGHPLRSMVDQGGMNEAGLMFDGFGVPPKDITTVAVKPLGQFDMVLQRVMRTCATVHEAAAIFREYDMRLLTASLIWLVDRTGDYLVVESDTLFTGSDAVYAVGNFRASSCTNFDAVEIPRYQLGRALLASGADTSLSYCTAVMRAMQVCRTKLGNGTLYTNLFDLNNGVVHLYFYHDFTERRSFNLKDELAKGDRVLEIPVLFGPNAEYEQLVRYRTPFHSRALFYAMVAMVVLAVIIGSYTGIMFLIGIVAIVRRRKPRSAMLPLVMLWSSTCCMAALVPFLLFNEGAYYFGLSASLDGMPPTLAYLPLLLCSLAVPLAFWTYRRRMNGMRVDLRWCLTTQTGSLIVLLGLLAYWGLLLP